MPPKGFVYKRVGPHSVASRRWVEKYRQDIRPSTEVPRPIPWQSSNPEYVCNAHLDGRSKFLQVSFTAVGGEEYTPAFYVTDPGKREYSSLDVAKEEDEVPHQVRTRELGRTAGKALLEKGIRGVLLHRMEFPAHHYLQRKPKLVAGVFHGLLDSGVKLEIYGTILVRLAIANVPNYFKHFLKPLRGRDNCNISIRPSHRSLLAALLISVPPEERLPYLHYCDELWFENAEELELGYEENRLKKPLDERRAEYLARHAIVERPYVKTKAQLHQEFMGSPEVTHFPQRMELVRKGEVPQDEPDPDEDLAIKERSDPYVKF